MLRAGEDFEILDPVVPLVAVNMVYYFIRPKFAAKMLLHDEAMFKVGFAIYLFEFVFGHCVLVKN